MNSDGSNVRALTHNNISGYPLSWSPDGRYIAYTLFRKDSNGWIDHDDTGIYVMDANGNKQKQLIDFPDSKEAFPIWGPLQ